MDGAGCCAELVELVSGLQPRLLLTSRPVNKRRRRRDREHPAIPGHTQHCPLAAAKCCVTE